ncbi:MAG: hypothetical protein AB7K52_05725 [Phycisphaerales bacterium]
MMRANSGATRPLGAIGAARSDRPVRAAVLALVAAAGCAGTWSTALAQVAAPPEVIVPVEVDSGAILSPSLEVAARGERRLVWTGVVAAPAGAPWMRVPLNQVQLAGDVAMGTGATLRLTSLADGAVQALDADRLGLSGGWSAYFNGPAVRVELFASAGTGASRVRIDSLVAGVVVENPATICDSIDDRVTVLDLRVARGGGGCSIWTINDLNGGMLSAGHCASAVSSTVEFNVPPSTSGGTIQRPPPEDQYPMDLSSRQFTSGGQGNDYLYIGVFPNSNHGYLPRQRYGTWLNVAAAAPSSGAHTFRVTGYGTASPSVENQVEQTHTGPFVSLSGNTLRYRVDTTGGNSGSPVIHEGTGQAVGIHTHAGCNATGGSNVGTAVQHAGLRNALNAPLGVSASGSGVAGGGGGGGGGGGELFLIGDRQNNFGTVNLVPQRFGRVAQIGANWQGLAWRRGAGHFVAINTGGEVFLISPAGEVLDELGPLTRAGSEGEAVGTLLTGLASDPRTDALYAYAPAAGRLYTIDLAAREAAPIGDAQPGSVRALAFDTARERLVGVRVEGGVNTLVRIDTASGEQTPIGPLGLAVSLGDIAYDPGLDALLGVHPSGGLLVRIDPASGAATTVGGTGGVFGPAYGLAFRTVCALDVNGDGAVTPDDLGDYINCYFTAPPCPGADVNADGVTDADDLGDFINAFFGPGC